MDIYRTPAPAPTIDEMMIEMGASLDTWFGEYRCRAAQLSRSGSHASMSASHKTPTGAVESCYRQWMRMRAEGWVRGA